MSWSRYLDLYVDLSRAGTRAAFVSSAGEPVTVEAIQADELPIRLRFCQPSTSIGGEISIEQLEAGTIVVLSGKVAGDLKDGDLLFLTSDWSEVTDGDDVYYAGALSLNTVEMASAFSAADGETISLTIETELQNAANTERVSFQSACTLHAQVYAGEGDPTDADHEYPAASTIVLKTPTDGSAWRWKDGEGWQVQDRITGKWSTAFLENGAWAFGPEED